MENTTTNLFITTEPSFQLATSAFMDDTLWIDSSKEGLQETLDLSTEFFVINDVQINGHKSELLVINSSFSESENTVIMGSDRAQVKAKSKTRK